MNTDIRLSVGFWQHPKTRKIVRRLGLDGVRSLQVLWLWAAQNRPEGNLSGMDWEDVELAADWQGDEHAFFDLCVGMWIDETPEGYVLHDWAEHNPWQSNADARKKQSQKAALARWGNAEKDSGQCSTDANSMQAACSEHADSMPTACRQHADSNAPLPFPSLPDPDPEEKTNTARARVGARFEKPTVKEVCEYCRERNNGIDGQEFWNFYESKGWLIGKNPMKSWRAAVGTWERNRVNAPQSRASPYMSPAQRREQANRDELEKFVNGEV